MMSEYKIIKKDGYVLTNYRALCRRATMWIGQTCNQRCKFCYYAKILDNKEHPQNGFMSLKKIKEIGRVLVEKYNNNAVDIEGGEPTIYKDVIPMIEYFSEIGLKPTLITNALVLDNMEKLKKINDAGLYDFLISVHALGETYDELVRVPGASNRQMKAIDNMRELKIPFRFNTVLSADVLDQLMDVAKLAAEKGARAVNFIAYNPFQDQSEERTTEIPSYVDIMKNLTPAIDYLEENEVEVNLRYVPFCVVEERHRKNIQDFQQRIWDLHEWESAEEVWTAAPEQREVHDRLSCPPDFFKSMNDWRRQFQGDPFNNLIAKLQNNYTNKTGTIVLFGHPKRNKEIADLIKKSNVNVNIAAFVSTKQYVTSDTINGFPFRDENWLVKNRPDLIIVTSMAYYDDIMHTLAEKGLADIAMSSYLNVGEIDNEYIRDFNYTREFKEIEGFSDLEYAYKEHRLLCSKVNPYYKKGKCEECSLYGICDGFHADYVELKGTGEIKPIKLGQDIVDPRYYMVDQLKVVEDEEADWALPHLHVLSKSI